jgi:hypothetical protein
MRSRFQAVGDHAQRCLWSAFGDFREGLPSATTGIQYAASTSSCGADSFCLQVRL